MLLSAMMMLIILEYSATAAREGIMEFTCRTAYAQKALTAASRALRKTIRTQDSFAVRHWTWSVIALAVISFWLSWGTAWQMVLGCAIIFGLLIVNWKGDAAAAEAKWQYDRILALAETGEYLVLVMGKNHALAMEKVTLEGGSLPDFRRFLEERSGQKIQNIGG